MIPLLTATDLVQYAGRRESQGVLPLLVRRLIRSTVDPLAIDIPAGDSVSRPGYDGIVQTTEARHPLPPGQSVWEMGVNQGPATKANGDYATRRAEPGPVTPAETTFVFVTLQRWPGKNEWAAARRAENFWLDVIVLDADDVEQWLETCPAVAAWARRQIVGMPEGVEDLDAAWDGWATRTTPQLSPEFFTSGREDQAAAVRGWFDGPPSCIRLRADTAGEAIGFVAAIVQTLDPSARERVRSRALIVSTPEAWRFVTGRHRPVIVIATEPFGTVAPAVARGHHVAVVYGSDAVGLQVDVNLPPLRRSTVEDALRRMGVADGQARRVATDSRGRVAVVVDLLGGGTQVPRWATPAEAPLLVPLFLAGSWSEGVGDADAIARLARTTADEVTVRLSRWAQEPDAPVRLVGGMWEWVARRRAWPYLARYLTTAELAAFREVAAEVLGEIDPALDLPPEQRWTANLHNKIPRYSWPLRRGLAEALAMLAADPSAARTSLDVATAVVTLVRSLFGPSPDPRRWCSLASVLPLLAEAAPAEFIAAVRRDVVGDETVRLTLFHEEGPFGGGGGRHSHLLWALETLAWCPDHLTDVAVLLADLTATDPGGPTANRPHASLRAILLPWCPGTAASAPYRVEAIDAVHRQRPEVGFDLCLRLLPSRDDVSMHTSRPHWRTWAAGADDRRSLPPDYEWHVSELLTRAFAWAGEEQRNWARLFDVVPGMGHDQWEQFVGRLSSLPLEQFASSPGDELRRAVRRLLHQRRTVPVLHGTATDEQFAQIEAAYARLEPGDPVRRDAWLFDTHPELFATTYADWEAERDARERERRDVVGGLLAAGRTGEVLRLADAAEEPEAVGVHLGQSALPDDQSASLLGSHLDVVPGKRPRFAWGLARGRFERDGWAWVGPMFAAGEPRSWAAEVKVAFAYALPFGAPTWDWVLGWGEDVNGLYWHHVRPLWLQDPANEGPRAIQSLLVRHRPITALRFALSLAVIGDQNSPVPARLKLDVLRQLTARARGEVTAGEKPDLAGTFRHDLDRLLADVESAGVIDDEELASTELVWLPLLDYVERGPRALHRQLGRNPEWFVQAVRLAYLPDRTDKIPGPGGPPADALDEIAVGQARYAHRVLESWHGFPSEAAGPEVDAAAVRAWVVEARRLLSESGHIDVGDRRIGEVMARIPVADPQSWPHPVVRDLLEELRSNEVEDGIDLGVHNGRGVTSRTQDTGGALERSVADRFAAAAKASVGYPRTAGLLRRLADGFRRLAQHHDMLRDLNEFDG